MSLLEGTLKKSCVTDNKQFNRGAPMKSLGRAFAYLSGASFFSTLMSIVKGKAAAILLGTIGVGIFNQITLFWNLSSSLVSMGMRGGVVRSTSKYYDEGNYEALQRLLSSIFILLGAVSATVALVGLFFPGAISFLLFGSTNYAHLIVVGLLGIPLMIIADLYIGLMSGVRHVKGMAGAQIVTDLLSLLFFLILVWKFLILGAVLSLVILQGLKLLFTLIFLKKFDKNLRLRPSIKNFSWPVIKENSSYGATGLFMVALSNGTVLLASRFIIGTLGLAANGVFAVAYRVSSVYLQSTAASARGHYFPTLAACRTDEEVVEKINEALCLYIYILFPIISFLIVFSKPIITILFSEKFEYASVMLTIILVGDIFRIVGETIGLALYARKRLIPFVVSYFVYCIIFIVLVFFSLKKFELISVASAYSIAYFVYCFVVILLTKRLIGFSFNRSSSRIFAASLFLISLSVALYFFENLLVSYFVEIFILLFWIVWNWKTPMSQKIISVLTDRFRLKRRDLK